MNNVQQQRGKPTLSQTNKAWSVSFYSMIDPIGGSRGGTGGPYPLPGTSQVAICNMCP